MYNAFLTITLMTFYLGYVLICLYVCSISAVVKVVMWSRGLTWRSQVGANPIPIPHPTNLALFGHKITLYIFNQGAHTVAGAQIGAGGWAPWPPHFNRCLSVVHCHVCFSSLLWAVLPELNWSIDWLTDWRTDGLTDWLIDWLIDEKWERATWFLSSSQFLYSCSPSFWNVTMTKPTKMLTMKKAMMMM